MTKAFEKISAGLENALAYADGDAGRGVTHEIEIIDVKAVRESLGMSQNVFARTFRLKPASLKNWEQKRREPDQTAKVLYYLIAKEPDAVLRALKEE